METSSEMSEKLLLFIVGIWRNGKGKCDGPYDHVFMFLLLYL